MIVSEKQYKESREPDVIASEENQKFNQKIQKEYKI